MSDTSLIPRKYANCTTSDSTPVAAVTLGIYVGTAGDVVVGNADGTTATFKAGSGQIIPGQFWKIMATGTTASAIVLIFGE
jgi:hypothetical protein